MKADLTLRTDREETWVVEIDGEEWTPQQLKALVHFVRRVLPQAPLPVQEQFEMLVRKK